MHHDVQAHITSSLCTLTAFVVCMVLSAMIGVMVCIWRFHVREERRRVAQAQRREEGVRWIRRRVLRALVLAQDISKLRLADSNWSARVRQLARSHARSLVCTASVGARRSQHVSGRMLCACFREFSHDNWLLKATGTKLYKAVHDRPVPTPVPSAQQLSEQELQRLQEVEHQVVRQLYAWNPPQAGETDFEREGVLRKPAGADMLEKQVVTEAA